jgi:hypothetical protein
MKWTSGIPVRRILTIFGENDLEVEVPFHGERSDSLNNLAVPEY